MNWHEGEFAQHACTFKPGDWLTLRPEAKETHWFDDFIKECGHGPYLVLRTHNTSNPGSECNLLGYPDGTVIPMYGNKNNPAVLSSWIFGHFFVRNNFLGLVHKAIQCNDLKSEP